MKDLFEYIFDPIVESILDVDNLSQMVDMRLTDSWIKENIKGQYKVMKMKNGTYKCWGRMILRDYDGYDFGGLVISSLQGDLFVENCPNITSLDGLFEKWNFGDNEIKAKVTGDIGITNCDKFDSMKGIPSYIDGKLSIVDCRNFRSLDYAPDMVADVNLIKNGKRWKESQIKRAFPCARRIMCSQETTELPIYEALSEPHLVEFWDWVKKKWPQVVKQVDDWNEDQGNKYYKKKAEKIQLDLLSSIRLDQIRPSDVTVYDNTKDKISVIRSALNKVTKGQAIVIVKDKTSGDYVYIVAYGWDSIGYNLKNWMEQGNEGRWSYRSDIKVNFNKRDILDLAGTTSGRANGLREFIIIDITSSNTRNSVQADRRNAQYNMVKLPHEVEDYAEYCKQLAQKNIERWKNLIAKARAENVSVQYLKLAEKFEPLVKRYAELPNKLKDEQWVKNHYYDGIMDSGTLTKASQLITRLTHAMMKMMGNVYKAQGKIDVGYRDAKGAMRSAQEYYKTVKEYLDRLDSLLKSVGL